MKMILLLACALPVIFGCAENFSPNGPYEKKLIVYSILDASTDTQYVRVLSTYSPDDYDPQSPVPNREISNAIVVLNDGSTDFTFRDTVITVTNQSGNSQQIKMYVNYKVRLQQEQQLLLTVNAQGFTAAEAQSVALIPGDAYPINSGLFLTPTAGRIVQVNVTLGTNVLAYLVTIQIEYEYLTGSIWHPGLLEIPSAVLKNSDGIVTKKFYPNISYRSTGTGQVGRNQQMNFETEAYQVAVQEIKDKYQAAGLRFKQVLVTLQQFDTELYSYYSVTNNFPGTTTLRLDEPDYTNIKGGFGIFGNVTKQTRSYYLPPGL